MKTAFWIAVLFALFCAALPGQEYRGRISGSIADGQGAVIPGAKVVVTELRTGTKAETVSGDSGAFSVPFLMPGDYEIAADAPGFKKGVRRGLRLSMGEHLVIDMALQVGDVAESVTVTAEAPLIQAADGSVGQVIATAEVENFPLNGGTPILLANLALGVVSTAEPDDQVRPFDNNGTSLRFSIGGSPAGTNAPLFNGAPNAGSINQAAYSPPQQAVQEVRVNAFDTDAAYGHSLGGTINLITKGGTNAFHGSVYEFNQVSALSGNYFYFNKARIRRPVSRLNQYGLTAGGPLWVPRVVDGRNRIFWFFAFEGLKSNQPQNATGNNPVYFATVPTPAQRKGDFSALLALNRPGTDYTIYDPATGRMSGTRVQRDPLPNNVIPASRLNPIALNYLKYYPLPNNANNADGFQNFTVNAMKPENFNNELGRLDFNLKDTRKLYFDFRQSRRDTYGNKTLGDDNPATGNTAYRQNWGSTVDYVHTISPTLVADIRLNWTRFVDGNGLPSEGMDPTELAFPGYIAANSTQLVMPGMVFTATGIRAGGQRSFEGMGRRANWTNNNTSDSFQLFASLMKVRGNHAIKAGVDAREYRWSSRRYGDAAGNYTFTHRWTNGPLNNAAASPLGQDFAAFLLGLPTSGAFDVNTQSTTSAKYYGLFLQEDWRVRRHLTLNLGLRWEYETPARERFDRATSGFDAEAANAISAAAAAAYAKNPIAQVPAGQFRALGGLTFAGPGRRDLYSMNTGLLSPRFGFAWTPAKLRGKTVVRGGFGVFVAPIGIVGNLSGGFNYLSPNAGLPGLRQQGFSQTTQFLATNDNYLSPAGTLSNPFPAGIVQPAGSSLGASTFLGQTVNYFGSQVHNPYAMRWNLGIQRELPGQMVLEVAYIGNHGVGLLVAQTDRNYIPRQFLSASPVRDDAVIDFLNEAVPNPFRGVLPNSSALNGATIARQQLLAPFPQFPVGGVVQDLGRGGSSYYQSLNVRVQKRTRGLTLMNTFLWSRLIDRMDYLNPSDPAPEKRTSEDSRPLRSVTAATYRLPVGRGMRFDLGSRVLNAVLGGWMCNAILTLQSGPQIIWGNVIYYGGSVRLDPHQPDGPAFDITRFNNASAEQLSQNIRTFSSVFNNLRRDTTKNLNFSMAKEVPFGEQKEVQLRLESFNTFNRTMFGEPNTTPGASTFGTISGQANTPRRIQAAVRVVW